MNCKPGDLAIICAVVHTGDNGQVVTVLRRAFTGDIGQDGTRLNTSSPSWWVGGSFTQTMANVVVLGKYTEAAFADSALRPITPPPGTVTTEEVKELFSPSPSMEPANG